MDFTGLQMTLTVVIALTAAAAVIFFDHRRKQRAQQPPQRINSHIYLVGTATRSRPSVEPRLCETVTVQMASPSPSAPSSSTEIQLAAASLPAFTIDAALWERLMASQPNRNLIAPPIEDVAPGPDTTFTQWPSGMIQQPALEELLASEDPFTGLVISIGINGSDSSMWHSRGLVQSVGIYIATLLREQDFSCRTSYDEFVIVCPGEEVAQSQRRLNHFSERLWDYQLRGIGACSILFSWGGVQVKDQPLAEAIASATDRMRETKRSGSSANSGVAHRQAV